MNLTIQKKKIGEPLLGVVPQWIQMVDPPTSTNLGCCTRSWYPPFLPHGQVASLHEHAQHHLSSRSPVSSSSSTARDPACALCHQHIQLLLCGPQLGARFYRLRAGSPGWGEGIELPQGLEELWLQKRYEAQQ